MRNNDPARVVRACGVALNLAVILFLNILRWFAFENLYNLSNVKPFFDVVVMEVAD